MTELTLVGGIDPAGDAEAAVAVLTPSVQATATAALEFAVDSPADYENAGRILLDIKRRAKEIDQERRAITVPMDEAKKRVLKLFEPIINELAASEGRLKASMLSWKQAEDARQRQAEIEARAEQRRLELEAEKKAKRLEARGKTEEAADVRYEAAVTPLNVPAVVKPAAPGISTRTIWSAEVTDKLALVRAVASGAVALDILTVNQTVADGLARSMQHNLNVPGLKARPRETMAARG